MMQLSARNQLPGTIVSVKEDAILAEVTVQLENGPEIVSVITAGSIKRLNLIVGANVIVVVKATEVLLATSD